jgi:c-di-GMP-binding flagellar brake protein YcgR
MTEERRKKPRFQIRQPISLELRHNSMTKVLRGTTENISLTGVLVATDKGIPENTRLDLTLELAPPSTPPPHRLRLPNSGKIVRVDRRPDGTVSIAIQCDRAFELVTATHAS